LVALAQIILFLEMLKIWNFLLILQEEIFVNENEKMFLNDL
jgi:hypothetical protein